MAVDLTLSEERANLLSLLRQCERICLSESSEAERAFQLLMKVWTKASDTFWYLGYWIDYLMCGNVALNSAKFIKNAAAKGQIFCELGWLYMEWEEYAIAQEYYDQALLNFQSIGDLMGQCRALRYFGVLHSRQDLLYYAQESYRQALEIVASESHKAPFQSDWAMQEAELHNLLGCLYANLDDLTASYHSLHLSLDKYRSLGEKYRYYQAAPLLNLGRWHFHKGEHEKARQYYQQCYNISKEVSRTDMVAGVLLRMAELAEAEGNQEKAIKLATESESVADIEIKAVRNRAARFREKIQAEHLADNM